MGGTGTPSAPSAPPQPQPSGETSAEAIQAQIDALPKILESQKEYGPQFSQLNLEQLQHYGPEFAETALNLEQQYAPQYKEISDILNPEVGAAQRTLTSYLNQSDQQEYDALKGGVMEDVRAGQSLRGIGTVSPLGSIEEGVQLARLKSSLKDRRLNIALTTAGRTPISGMPQIQGTTGTDQLVQNVNPDSIFNYQSSLNNFNASLFNTEAQKYGIKYQGMTAANASASRGALGWVI